MPSLMGGQLGKLARARRTGRVYKHVVVFEKLDVCSHVGNLDVRLLAKVEGEGEGKARTRTRPRG